MSATENESRWAELLTLFSDLFAGRFDVYAEGHPHRNPLKREKGKLEYFPVREPLTPAVLKAHIKGTRRIGVYPLVDGYVRWFAIDFDAPKVKDPETGKLVPMPGDAFPKAWDEAVKQATAFEQAGLFVYLERSQSGQGVHLWGFLEEPVRAELVVQALGPLLLDAASYDRMYPVQDAADDLGNLLALPFYGPAFKDGNAAFLNRDTLEPIDPIAFMRGVTFNYRDVIEEMAARAPKVRPATIKRERRETVDGDARPAPVVGEFSGRPPRPISGFLKLISPFGCAFMRRCMEEPRAIQQTEWWVAIGQTTCFRNGRDAAHLLSQLDPDRYDPAETDAIFDRISGEVPHGCAWIHANFPKSACSGCPMTAPYHMAEKPILELARETATPLRKQDWQDALQRIRRRNAGKEKVGVMWGVAGLDDYTRLRRGEFIVVGARPSVGKTAFMVDAAVSLASRGVPCLIFSAETGEETLQDRILANVAKVDSRKLRGESVSALTDEELAALDRAAATLATWPLYINYAATRADQILALVEDVVLTERIPLDQDYVVFMDYLQFGNATDVRSGDTEYARITKVSQEYKYLAAILNRAYVTFSQLKREAEGDEVPSMDAFRSSGQIEQDMNVGMILAGERLPGPTARRTMHLVKQKEGVAGVVIELLLQQAYCHFEPIPTDAPVPAGGLFEPTSEVV